MYHFAIVPNLNNLSKVHQQYLFKIQLDPHSIGNKQNQKNNHYTEEGN